MTSPTQAIDNWVQRELMLGRFPEAVDWLGRQSGEGTGTLTVRVMWVVRGFLELRLQTNGEEMSFEAPLPFPAAQWRRLSREGGWEGEDKYSSVAVWQRRNQKRAGTHGFELTWMGSPGLLFLFLGVPGQSDEDEGLVAKWSWNGYVWAWESEELLLEPDVELRSYGLIPDLDDGFTFKELSLVDASGQRLRVPGNLAIQVTDGDGLTKSIAIEDVLRHFSIEPQEKDGRDWFHLLQDDSY